MSPSPQKPRLLVLTPDFPPAPGGIQVLTHRVARGLDGFDVRVLTLDGVGAARFDETDELQTRRVAGTRWPSQARIARLNAAAFIEALGLRPSVTLSAHIVVSPAAAAIRRVLHAPTVQYFHANEIAARTRLAAFASSHADVAIAVSSYTASLVKQTGATPADLRVIPPGVDLAPERTTGTLERPTLLTIARLNDSYKGHDILIKALEQIRANVPDVQWIIIGDGPLRPDLEALACSLKVDDAIRFLGSVSDEQRDWWLSRADVFAMPSRLPGNGLAGEGFGIVYLEAAAHGLPVLAGNVAGALDAIADGESGLLVNPSDPLEVAQATTRLLLDRELALRLGEAGAKRAKNFAWPLIAARVQAVLLEQARAGARQAGNRM